MDSRFDDLEVAFRESDLIPAPMPVVLRRSLAGGQREGED